MARPRSNFRGRVAPRRLTQWIGSADQGYVGVAAAGATLIQFVSFEEPVTVIRSRGHVSVQPGSFAADLNVVGAVGVGVVSTEALTAGVGSMPEPFSDADWSWMVWRSFSFHLDVQSAVGFDVNSALEFEIDSKAMRKIHPNESLVTIAESQQGAFDISFPIRTLTKLS